MPPPSGPESEMQDTVFLERDSVLAEMEPPRRPSAPLRVEPVALTTGTSGLAASGEDLYANLQISCDRVEPETDHFGDFELGTLPASVLARYDGKRWHILPNGLLAALGQSSSSLASPGDNILCATYGGLPERGNRYSVISISSDPFEFQE